MNAFLFLILILHVSRIAYGKSTDIVNETSHAQDEMDSTATPPPGQGGRSFFLFGGFFHKLRQRWLGYQDPVPLYAGPAFPISGYYNCPVYGCDPSLTYRPAPYEPPNYYNNRPAYPYNFGPPSYRAPLQDAQQLQQQQKQHSQQSSVVIYQNGQQQHQQQLGQQDYHNQNYLPSFGIPSGGAQYYPSPTAQPLPYLPVPNVQNYPSDNVPYYPNAPPYPNSNYGEYIPPEGLAIPSSQLAPQNYDPIYSQQQIPSGTIAGPFPVYPPPIGGAPPCAPHNGVYPCQGGV